MSACGLEESSRGVTAPEAHPPLAEISTTFLSAAFFSKESGKSISKNSSEEPTEA
jgi:hypothetical protein